MHEDLRTVNLIIRSFPSGDAYIGGNDFATSMLNLDERFWYDWMKYLDWIIWTKLFRFVRETVMIHIVFDLSFYQKNNRIDNMHRLIFK